MSLIDGHIESIGFAPLLLPYCSRFGYGYGNKELDIGFRRYWYYGRGAMFSIKLAAATKYQKPHISDGGFVGSLC